MTSQLFGGTFTEKDATGDLQDDSTIVEKPDRERGGSVLLMKVDQRKSMNITSPAYEQ